MKERSSIEQPATLPDIPMLVEYDREMTEAVAKPEYDMPAHERREPFGIYSSDELRLSRAQLPTR